MQNLGSVIEYSISWAFFSTLDKIVYLSHCLITGWGFSMSVLLISPSKHARWRRMMPSTYCYDCLRYNHYAPNYSCYFICFVTLYQHLCTKMYVDKCCGDFGTNVIIPNVLAMILYYTKHWLLQNRMGLSILLGKLVST